MKVLKPLVDELVKLIKKGVNLAKDELPVIAKQILAFYFWSSVVWVVVGVVLLLTGVFCHLHALIPVVPDTVRHWRDADNSDGGSWLWILGAVVTYLAGTLITVSNTIDIIKIKVAPRLFLLEYLKGFLDSND